MYGASPIRRVEDRLSYFPVRLGAADWPNTDKARHFAGRDALQGEPARLDSQLHRLRPGRRQAGERQEFVDALARAEAAATKRTKQSDTADRQRPARPRPADYADVQQLRIRESGPSVAGEAPSPAAQWAARSDSNDHGAEVP